MSGNLNIAFIHPDLGIGGAERLIVDAAMALQSANNKVSIYTSHCDPTHCFEEIKDNSLKVIVYGDFLPTGINGKFKIIFAFLRQLYLTTKLILTLKIYQYDIIILDQLSYCIPLLHLFAWNTKILFYCHFPDKLLASHGSLIRKIYRFLFDLIEEVSTSYSDKILVNSQFTKSIVRKTFTHIEAENLEVVYPCVSVSDKKTTSSTYPLKNILNKNSFFLSINRFERKKNIQLAIESFSQYIVKTNDKSQSIIIAGGYDKIVDENVRYHNELQKLCDDLKLSHITINGKDLNNFKPLPNETAKVIFLTSISTDLKDSLIEQCDLLLYTPSNEHFGIVPLEAMRMGKLVLADNTGGPLETIVNYFDDKNAFTGFTVASNVSKWEDILEFVKGLSNDELTKISERCKARVDEKFSFNSLKIQLVKVCNELLEQPTDTSQLIITHLLVPIISTGLILYLYKVIFN